VASSVPVTADVVDVVAVTVGGSHSCALRSDGQVFCWGRNADGQVGDNTTVDRSVPVKVLDPSGGGFLDDAVAISAGGSHTCAVRGTGEVLCWGDNSSFQLGDGTDADRHVPVVVVGITSATAVSAGVVHTCAIVEAGQVWCWGDNTYGQLGNNSTVKSAVPVMVVELSGAFALAAGSSHTCALIDAGEPWCWGYNGEGQLGNGTNTTSGVPVPVVGVGDAVTITAGWYHYCAQRATGQVVCWGFNPNGQLGNDTTTSSNTPVPVTGLGDASALGAGIGHSCAVRDNGDVVCWGYNGSGQLGNGRNNETHTPVAVIGLTPPVNDNFANAVGLPVAGGTTEGHNIGATLETGEPSHGAFGGSSVWWDYTPTTSGVLTLTTNGSGIDTLLAVYTGTNFDTPLTLHDSAVPTLGEPSFLNTQVIAGVTYHIAIDTITGAQGPITLHWTHSPHPTITSGNHHACALRPGGHAVCWGDNVFGGLGDGTTTNSNTPVPVVGLTDAVAISADRAHTCALRANGHAVCWGVNDFGGLGDGTTTESHTPVPVVGLTDAVAISAGIIHTCALRTNGHAVCWGDNGSGELGDGTTTESHTPVPVVGLTDAVAISAGDGFTCALRANGHAVCWGDNGSGELGDGTTTSSNTPVGVVGLTDAVAISAGLGFTCAVRADGHAVCWGDNTYGELGDGTTTSSNTPVPVVGLEPAVNDDLTHATLLTGTGGSVSSHNLDATKQSGEPDHAGDPGGASVWFDYTPSTDGVLGVSTDGSSFDTTLGVYTGTTIDWLTPIASDDDSGPGTTSQVLVTVTAGVTYHIAIDGSLGATGAIALHWTHTPHPTIDAAGQHTCALRGVGRAACWGSNLDGQLGNGTTTDAKVPVTVTGLTDAVAITNGAWNHACALRSNGQVACWGHNSYGQLGNGTSGTSSTTPVPVAGLTDAVAITAGSDHACALRSDGHAACWGRNFDGQLGDGTTADSNVPVPVAGLDDAVAIIAGYERTCAIRANGQAVCWGSNWQGELGDGTTADSSTPVPVVGLTDATAITAGAFFTCAIRANGQAMCWGANHYGQLGNGNTGASSLTAVPVVGLTDAVTISSGGGHSCAIRVNGETVCWGYNGFGQLGNGTFDVGGSNVPVVVTGLADAASITAGGEYSCARRTDGQSACWGYNAYGQMGDGTTTTSGVPVRVRFGLVPADFDGDGDSDIGVFRPSVGGWYIQGQTTVFHGLPGDIPVPGDYDGDGDTDRAVYRPAVGGWYIQGQTTVFHGLPGDIPVPGDYDGDGRTDRAVYRPAVGGWYIQGQPTVFHGLDTDTPVPGDYNGDSLIDPAVFRPSAGAWLIHNQAAVFHGLGTDTLVPGDYNGDGHTDPAVFRPSVGAWYITGRPVTYHGLTNDIPLTKRP
jgi:alpha-tubulin suppressor-like RCC1 family protein